ncbi:Cupredoxin-like domain-containing protein [Oryzisolibacter propanilivorax]|uniref:Cupredoxin-like domain-containing protein n=1 Tax=Oryzisolibacter propanilivorax TaxID=1527607 RepID=A0A1G9Q8X8_9BURK|nr:cupredoxin domain-containing protein [Oryzisolibacter propanilivorax]SDM07410.1 Cupredoxin-like domain-containing protein [Oryzisolibacter propanilivorax]
MAASAPGSGSRLASALQRLGGRATPLLAALLLAGGASAAHAAGDIPTFRVVLNDGQISTRRIELPAKQRFRIEVVNEGKTPAEFESLPLGIELVVAPHSTRTRALPGKSPGTYPFFDEFHMDTTRGEFVIQ